jgi:hypothetical protein
LLCHHHVDEIFVEDVEDVVAGREFAVFAGGRAPFEDLLGSQDKVSAEGSELGKEDVLPGYHRVNQRHIIISFKRIKDVYLILCLDERKLTMSL